MKHKWHKEIKAWADGDEIEYKSIYSDDDWEIDNLPDWSSEEWEYRIKPQPKEQQYLYAYLEPETGNYKFNYKKIKIYEQFYIGKIKLEVDDE